MRDGGPFTGDLNHQRQLTRQTRRRQIVIAAAAVSLFAATRATQGATATWTGAAGDSLWATGGNWDSGIAPGTTAGAAGNSSDIAVFNTTGGAGFECIPDTNRNILGITYDIAVAGSGRSVGISGATDPLYLTGGGTVAVTANNITTTSDSINSPLVLLGNYTFRNDSTTGTSGLKVNTSITSGATGPITITLDGVNASGALTSNNQFAAAITDGPGSAVGVVKNGTAEWDLRASAVAPNTYSGDTVLNAGAIRFNGAGALSPNSNYFVHQGATFRPSVSGTIHSLTVTSPIGYLVPGETTPRATLTESGGAVVSITTNTGPALTLDMSTATGTADFGVPVAFTGNVALQGGIEFINSDTTPRIVYGKPVDLGTVDRVIDVGRSATNVAAGDPNLQINGAISGSGGIVKTGPGTLKIGGSSTTANSYNGATTIEAGRVIVAANGFGPILSGPNGANIKNGRMIFDYTGTTTPAGSIESMLTAARPSNFTSGQLRSTTANGSRGLGWTDDGTSKVTVAAALYGDNDLSGNVDLTDFTFLAANFNKQSGAIWKDGDYNYDDKVDLTDFTFLASNFNSTLPDAFAAGSGSPGSPVPEPASLLSTLLGTALLTRRRRC